MRPQALPDQQGEVFDDRKDGGARVAVRLVKAITTTLCQIELDPGLSSPTRETRMGIAARRTWSATKFLLR